VAATGAVGSVTISADANVAVTGVEATGEISSVNVYNIIIPNQNPNYVGISPAQTPAYSNIAPNQNPNYTEIAA
jgi:hypothetical protein